MNSIFTVSLVILFFSTYIEVNGTLNFKQKLTICRNLCIFRLQERTCYVLPGRNLTVSNCVYYCLIRIGANVTNATRCQCEKEICLNSTMNSSTKPSGLPLTNPNESSSQNHVINNSAVSTNSKPTNFKRPSNTKLASKHFTNDAVSTNSI